MASPALESFCCLIHQHQNYTSTVKHDTVFTNEAMGAYNIICIISGTLGILGSFYQLYPRRPNSLPQTRRGLLIFARQNKIICFLALADLMATLGIVVRSSLWLSGIIPWKKFIPLLPSNSSTRQFNERYISCAVTSGWIQYFYVCTYFWTLFYAVHVYRILLDKVSIWWLYHSVCWGFSFIVTASGLVTLYYPSLLRCVYDTAHLLPHFLSTYIPILLVMIAAPILYWQSAKTVKAQVILRRGQYTDQERAVVKAVRGKFRVVTLVFFVCWTPNILNGLLLAFRSYIVHDVFIAVWMAMSVLNPLQGFLNCLVYRGAGGFSRHLRWTRTQLISEPQDEEEEDDEDAPLLSFRSR